MSGSVLGELDDALARIEGSAAARSATHAAILEGAVNELRGEPEPLRRPLPPPQPYPVAELGDVLAPAAQAIRRVIQAPDAICGASLLAAASLAAQALADVHVDGRVIPTSLWMLSIAESGERKSSVDAEAMRAARVREHELGELYAAEQAHHVHQLAEWKARCEAEEREANQRKGRGLADALEDIGSAPLPPLDPRLTVADFTPEGLFKLLAAGQPSVGAFTDEAALVFGGHAMNRETVMRTAGTLCKLWDRGELDRIRSSDGASRARGRRFAMHLLAQPVIAERALADDVLSGQGFLARCLLAWPTPTAGTRSYREESLVDDDSMRMLVAVLGGLHRQPLPLAEGQRQELAPRALQLTRDAKRAWMVLHDAIERRMGEGGDYAAVKPWASKSAEQALRVAGVLALVDDPAASLIDQGTMERAAEIALWHLNEAARIAQGATVSPQTRAAEAVLHWCWERRRKHVHSAELVNSGPSCVRDSKGLTTAMSLLESTGWATPLPANTWIDGAKRKRAWLITPATTERT